MQITWRRGLRFSLKSLLIVFVAVGLGIPFLIDQLRWYSVPRPIIVPASSRVANSHIQIRTRVLEMPTAELNKYAIGFERIASLATSVGHDGFLADNQVAEFCRIHSSTVLAEPTFRTTSGCRVTYDFDQPPSMATSIARTLIASRTGLSGLQLGLVPTLVGDGTMRVEVRPAIRNSTTPPGGSRQRWLDFLMQVRAQETMQVVWFHGQASGADTGLLIQAKFEVVESSSISSKK